MLSTEILKTILDDLYHPEKPHGKPRAAPIRIYTGAGIRPWKEYWIFVCLYNRYLRLHRELEKGNLEEGSIECIVNKREIERFLREKKNPLTGSDKRAGIDRIINEINGRLVGTPHEFLVKFNRDGDNVILVDLTQKNVKEEIQNEVKIGTGKKRVGRFAEEGENTGEEQYPYSENGEIVNSTSSQAIPGSEKKEFTQPFIEYIDRHRRGGHSVQRTLKEKEIEESFAGPGVGSKKESIVWNMEKLVNSDGNIVVIGESGAGKTTLLYSVFTEISQDESNAIIPIYVRLDGYIPHGREAFQNRIEQETWRLLGKNLTDEQLEGQHFLFLLDHLDQTRKSKERTVVDDIEDSFSDPILARHRFIIACRSNFYHFNLKNFKVLEIDDLSKTQIEEIMLHSQVPELYRFFLLRPDLQELVQKPLLLKMIIQVYKEKGTKFVFKDKVHLFKEFLTGFSSKERRRLERASKEVYSKKWKLKALSSIAFEMHKAEKWTMDYDDARDEMRSVVSIAIVEDNQSIEQNNPEKIIAQIEEEGLVTVLDREQCQFVHPSFQEFMCAWYMANYLTAGEVHAVIHPKLGDEDTKIDRMWRIVIIYYASLSGNLNELVAFLVNDSETNESIFFEKMMLVSVCISRAPEKISISIAEMLTQRIIKEYNVSRYQFLKDRRLRMLGQIRTKSAVHFLIQELRKTERGLQDTIGKALGDIGSEEVERTLLEYANSLEKDIRICSMRILDRIRSEKAIGLILEKLNSKDPTIRTEAFGAINVTTAGKIIIRVVDGLEDEVSEIRWKARSLLMMIGGARIVDCLAGKTTKDVGGVIGKLRLIRRNGELLYEIFMSLFAKWDDDDLQMRRWASSTIVELLCVQGMRVDIGSDFSGRMRDLIRRKLMVEDRDMRIETVRVIPGIKMEFGEIEDRLIEMLEEDDHQLKKEIVSTLSSIGSPKCFEKLKEHLDENDLEIRERAIHRFGRSEVDLGTALNPFFDKLDHPCLEVRQEVLSKLKNLEMSCLIGRISPARGAKPYLDIGVDAVAEKLYHEDSIVRQGAAIILGLIGSDEATDRLIGKMDDSEPLVRMRVLTALAKIQTPKKWEGVLLGVEDENPRVRAVACRISRFDRTKHREFVLKMLDNTRSDVRKYAVSCLCDFEPKEIEELLLGIMDKEMPEIRREAVTILKKIDSERAINEMAKLVNDRDIEVKKEAIVFVGEMAYKSSISSLLKCLDDEDVEVKFEAIRALEKIGPREITSSLLGLFDDPNPKIRRATAFCMAKIGPDEVIDEIVEKYEARRETHKENASLVIEPVFSGADVKTLIRYVDYEDSKIRKLAIESLHKKKSPAAFESLVGRLTDRNEDIRKSAELALNVLAPKIKDEEIMKKSEDRNALVRKWAFSVLWRRLSRGKSISHIVNGLDDEDSEIRRGAIYALGSVGTGEAIVKLCDLLRREESPDIKEEILKVLYTISNATGIKIRENHIATC
jgi:HEAT repeat protein